jgi:parallel beta-helix repeat protein
LKKKTTSGIMLTLMLIGVTMPFYIHLAMASGTIYIKADGSIDPPTAAIERSGDFYTFTDNIYDSIVVERNNTVIDGNRYTLQGRGASGSIGIDLSGITNVTVKNAQITNFNFGLSISLGTSAGEYIRPSNNSISGNNITNNVYGIALGYCSYDIIIGNNITANAAIGILLAYSRNDIISGNNITANDSGGISVNFLGGTSNLSIVENHITTNLYGISLAASVDTIVSGNKVAANAKEGILLAYSRNDIISGNNITANGESGIWLHDSSYGIVSGNNISGNGDGVICGSSNNTISENNIKNNRGTGICLVGSPWSVPRYNIVSHNSITNNGGGVDLDLNARYNNVTGNEISYNTDGVSISGDFTLFNNIWENNITHNTHGITGFITSYGNRFYHNNLIDNDEQVYSNWYPVDGPQVWDDGYPSGGNYWSDYQGVDVFSGPNQNETGSDGMGDTPYVIRPYSDWRPYIDMDHYPLMNPWTPTPLVVIVSIDIDPDTLNLRSKGKWITAYIQLPEGYNPEDIDASTILLNGSIQPVLDPKYSFVTNSSEYLVDHNNDGILERMLKFDRATLASFIYQRVGMQSDVPLTLTGKLADGTPFEGTDTVFVFWQGHRSPSKR